MGDRKLSAVWTKLGPKHWRHDPTGIVVKMNESRWWITVVPRGLGASSHHVSRGEAFGWATAFEIPLMLRRIDEAREEAEAENLRRNAPRVNLPTHPDHVAFRDLGRQIGQRAMLIGKATYGVDPAPRVVTPPRQARADSIVMDEAHAEASVEDRGYPASQSRNWHGQVYRRAVENTRGLLGDGAIVQARRELLAEAHAEALAEQLARTEMRAADDLETAALVGETHGLPPAPDSVYDHDAWAECIDALPMPFVEPTIADALRHLRDSVLAGWLTSLMENAEAAGRQAPRVEEIIFYGQDIVAMINDAARKYGVKL